MKRMPYSDLESLLAAELVHEEDAATAELIGALRPAKARGYLTKSELVAVCRWKSPRATRLVEANSQARVRRLSGRAFRSRSEHDRFAALTELDGVGPPSASAVLTLVDPRRYGVIDIRVWKLLFELGHVRTKAAGVGFTIEDWLHYLATLRDHAKRLRVPVRRVEYSLFLYHQRTRRGRLYGRGS